MSLLFCVYGKKISRQHLLIDYKKLKKTLRRRPTCHEFVVHHHSITTLDRVFGRRSWRKLLAAAGDRLKSDVTRDILIKDYRALKRLLNRQPSLNDYQCAYCGLWVIDKKFGKPGWRRLVEEAGDKLKEPPTADHLIEDFLDLQGKLGRRPRLADYEQKCHSIKVLCRAFGKPGWRNFIRILGEKAKPTGLTSEHLIQDYLETCMILGTKPTHYTFFKRHRHKKKEIDRVFGEHGWEKLQKASDKAKKEGTILPPMKKIKERRHDEILKDVKKTYRALMPGRLTDNTPATRYLAKLPAWRLRNRLQDLFYELGRSISLEEAFQ